MLTHRTARAALAAGLVLGLGLSLPAVAGPLPPEVEAALCPAGAPGTVGASGDAVYVIDSSVEVGKNGKPVRGGREGTLVHDGRLFAQWQMEGPSCLGARYTLSVSTPDGSPLGWSTGSATSSTAAPLSASGTPGVTTVSPDGSTAQVTFTGDGAVQSFAVVGNVDGTTQTCLAVGVTVTGADGTVLSRSATVGPCADLPGGTSMY